MMTSAYDQLLKYISNLLRTKRPQVWRSIKTNNTAFKARVTCMVGAEEILKQAGYSEVRSDSLCFPDDVTEPDKGMLSILASEILMAKLEVEQMNSNPVRTSPRQPHHPPHHPPVRAAAYETPQPRMPPSQQRRYETIQPRDQPTERVNQTIGFEPNPEVMRHFDGQGMNGAPYPPASYRAPYIEQQPRPQALEPQQKPPMTRSDSNSSDPP